MWTICSEWWSAVSDSAVLGHLLVFSRVCVKTYLHDCECEDSVGPGRYHKEQHAGWCIKYSKPDLILRLFSYLHPELWTLCSAPCWNCLMSPRLSWAQFNSCSPVTVASFHVSCRVTSDRTVLLRPAAVCHKCSFGTDDLRWSCFQECSRHTLSVMTE